MIRADLAREELVKELEALRQRVANLEGRELEQRYQAVFESANDVILLIDKNGKIIDVNQRLTEISGYKIDELIGKDFRSLSRIVSEKSLAIITDNFTKRIASGVVLPYEVEMMKKNGELVFLEISARPLRNGGKIIGDLVTLRDVTERKEAEKQKGLSLRVLQLLNQSVDKRELIHDLLYLFKEHGQFEAVGIRLRDGDDYPYYASNGFPDKHIAENRLCASDNDSKLLRNNQNDLKLECMCSNIIYGRFDPFKSFITKGGSFWTNSTTDLLASTTEADRQARTCNRCNAEGYESVALIPLKANNVTIGLLQINDTRRNCFTQELVRYYEGLAQSIGIALAQEEIEEALQASETKYRDLYKNAPAAYFSVGIDGLIKETNRAAQLLFGYSEEELIGKPRLELYAPDCAVKAQAVFEQLKVGISLFDEEMIYKKKDGVIVYGLLSTTYTKDVNGHVDTIRSVIKDITERKQAETTIRESQKRFMELAEMLPMSIFEIDDKGKYTYLNREAYKIWKSTKTIPEESLGNNALVAFIPEDGDRITRDVTSIFMGENIGHQEYTALRGDGTTFPVLIKMAPIIHENKIVGVRGIVIDITERKQAEEKLRQASREWRTTFDSITDFISIHDKDNRIIRVNKSMAAMLKTTPKELIGKFCHEVMHGTKEPPANCPHLQTLKTGKPSIYETFDPNHALHLYESASPLFNEKGEITGSVVVTRDVTQLKRMEEQMIMTDRLASIGELSSGIAHELNNPLTSVIGFSQLLLEGDVPANMKEDLGTVYSEAQRAAAIVKNLLTFARKHAPVKQLCQVNTVIEDVLRLRAYEQKVNNIEIEKRFESNLPEIMIDNFQMQQVFLNIVVNAEFAMMESHHRGKLTITTKKSDSFIKIAITDDGPGIAKENLKHIFDPFFTTKEVGKGTGLGLSICHGIVTEHGGQIYARSEKGQGATFVVELPLINEQ